MGNFKRFATLVLALVLLLGVCLPALSNGAKAADFSSVKGPTLVKSGGIWYYVKDGKICNVTTLVKYNGSWWYVVNGKVASNTTSLVKYNGEWWYVVKGKVASNTTTLVKYNNEWWYVVKGKIASKTTSLVKYNGEWWYVVKGKIAAKTTTLVKYNGTWYYIVKGKLAANTTTLVHYNGGWYYVNCGKVDNRSTTVVKYNSKWYYVNRGKVDTNALKVCYASDTEYRYDSQGRLTAEYAQYGFTEYTYNTNGTLAREITSYDGTDHYQMVVYSYKNNRLDHIQYTYSGDWDGETIYNYYSDGSYMTEEYDAESSTCTRYTADGKVIYSESICAGCIDRYYYEYNSNGDVASFIWESDSEWGDEYNGTERTLYRYEYNAQKKPISCIGYREDVEASATYYTYNNQGLVSQKLQFSDDCIYLFVYTYDKNGNCLTVTLYDVLTNRTLR